MSTPDERLAELERRMAAAVAAEDFEGAAALRDEIARARGGSRVRKLPPGEMGLGTDRPAHVPPPGWVKPPKPDLLTSGTRRGGRRRK